MFRLDVLGELASVYHAAANGAPKSANRVWHRS